MMAASAEVMIWLLIIGALVIIGKGKILPSEKPLIIERQGQYKMDLATGLNLAQPFIEALAKKVNLREVSRTNDLIYHFKVRDKHIASRKQPFYLLVISWKNEQLCFEAKPALQDQTVPNALTFAPDKLQSVIDDTEKAIHTIAKQWGIELQKVQIN